MTLYTFGKPVIYHSGCMVIPFFSFIDLPLSPDSPLLCDSADLDFGCDSGIEAEMDEPHGKNIIK